MDLKQVHHCIHTWYQKHGRKDLPWRNTRDPYAVWISEIMLQQTQVKTVKDRYYSLFINKFSVLEILAQAPQKTVLKVWQGMGYYQRAANLHKAAQILYEEQGKGCRLPATLEGLKRLPGIGENTARAILVFAYHQPVAVMEANVKRVLNRVFALENPSQKALFAKADALLDAENPYDYNQAMMDIGALICTPKAPKCGDCPLALICKGKNAPERYPAKVRRNVIPVRKKVIVVFQDVAGKYFVKPRTARFLHGLYGFMEYALGISIHFRNKLYREQDLFLLGKVKHSYSHFQLHANVYLTQVKEKHSVQGWKSAAQLEKLPLSRVDDKVLALLKNHLSAS